MHKVCFTHFLSVSVFSFLMCSIPLSRIQSNKVEYICCDGMAVVSKLAADHHDRIDVAEFVSANGGKFRVELFARKCFTKSTIRTVHIPKSVRSLPAKCFEFCENLRSVIFEVGSRVGSFGACCFIGVKCFDGCTNLSHVGMSECSELVSIGKFAFRGCMVSNLFLPSSLDVLECVGGFVGVKSVTVAKDSQFCLSCDCLMCQRKEILLHCFSAQVSLEVPDSVREIAKWCFCGCGVKEVTFGEKSKIVSLPMKSVCSRMNAKVCLPSMSGQATISTIQ